MVKSSMRIKDDNLSEQPDIFKAAINDDPLELRAALEAGQSLDAIRKDLHGMTPIHLACAEHSLGFLSLALSQNFNAWARDSDGRISMDYAVAEGLDEVADVLLEKLYPKDSSGRPLMPF